MSVTLAAPPLPVTDEQRRELEQIARSSSLPHRSVLQAKALLLAADGVAIYETARRLGIASNSVRTWRRRFETEGIAGVGRIAPGRGRRSWLPDGTVAAVVHDTMHSLPDDGSTHWTTRLMAERHGIGKDSVARIWRDHGLRPWKEEGFKVSSDSHFEDKLVDVVGLYMDPPEKAIVFSFDEKTQVQALDRTQPSLPMKRGRAGTMTHDYKRHGTTDLFAAMNVATGEVIYGTRKRHTSADVLGFFKLIDLHVPKGLEIHVVLDNSSTHKTPLIHTWLLRHPRFHLHFTPTSSSWLNLVWVNRPREARLAERRLRRGVFTSVDDLIEAIELWAEHWNDDPKPFVWKKKADEIVAKVKRGRAALASVNSATRH